MDRQRDRQPRALVLAGGGIAGGLYEIGVLSALDDIFDGFSTCDFDLYIGTSAGAFVGSLLANGVAPDVLRQAIESNRGTLPRLSGAQFLSFAWRGYLDVLPRLAAAVPRVAADLWEHWGDALVLDTLGSLLRHLPVGVFTLDGLEAYVRTVLSRGAFTNDFRRLPKRLLIPATVLDSGAIHVFGFSPDDPTPISAAVAASAAVPLLYEPVRIDGVDYVDAAITKTAHAGLAIDLGFDLVVTVNPLCPLVLDGADRMRDAGPLAVASQSLRIALQRRLHDGLARREEDNPHCDIVLFEPWAHDLRLFDTPLMTYTLRQEVVRRGYRTTTKTVLHNYEHYAALFRRHDIALVPKAEIERRAERWSSKAAASPSRPAAPAPS
jgi:predicted acylesterase/phospholipase RssA